MGHETAKGWEVAVSPLSTSLLLCNTLIFSVNHLSPLPVLSTLFILSFCKKKKKYIYIYIYIDFIHILQTLTVSNPKSLNLGSLQDLFQVGLGTVGL